MNALPLFATAVWRGRPYTVGVSRRAVAGVALWVGAFAFALPYRDLAPDVGLPRQPYVLLGAIAWASVAPLPGLLAVAIPRQRDRAQS